MTHTQDRLFERGEGDRYFERNSTSLRTINLDKDMPIKLIREYELHPSSVIEVGAANGARLAFLAAEYRARCVVIEPSRLATLNGARDHPDVHFVRGTASAIPVRANFELTIVNFVFHWIGRANLLRSVAEIDRLVGDGGYLIIGDFYPEKRIRIRYHHLPDDHVYTFKQDYAAMFLASGLYRMVANLTWNHASKSLDSLTSEYERAATCLLHKPRSSYDGE